MKVVIIPMNHQHFSILNPFNRGLNLLERRDLAEGRDI